MYRKFRLLILIKNIYILECLPRLLLPLTYIFVYHKYSFLSWLPSIISKGSTKSVKWILNKYIKATERKAEGEAEIETEGEGKGVEYGRAARQGSSKNLINCSKCGGSKLLHCFSCSRNVAPLVEAAAAKPFKRQQQQQHLLQLLLQQLLLLLLLLLLWPASSAVQSARQIGVA